METVAPFDGLLVTFIEISTHLTDCNPWHICNIAWIANSCIMQYSHQDFVMAISRVRLTEKEGP